MTLLNLHDLHYFLGRFRTFLNAKRNPFNFTAVILSDNDVVIVYVVCDFISMFFYFSHVDILRNKLMTMITTITFHQRRIHLCQKGIRVNNYVYKSMLTRQVRHRPIDSSAVRVFTFGSRPLIYISDVNMQITPEVIACTTGES